VLRADGVVTYASPAVRQLFGWCDAEVIDAPISCLLHPDDRDTLGGVPAAGPD
jgi:PAS domain S-box-containing protein